MLLIFCSILEGWQAMKLSFWDILASMVLLAGLAMGTIFVNIFINPHTLINPFPPATPVATLVVPTLTASPLALPEVWTSTPETPVSDVVKAINSSPTPTEIGTHFVLPTKTATRTRTASPTPTKSVTSTPNRTLTAYGYRTATLTATTAANTSVPPASTSTQPPCSTSSGYCDDNNPSIVFTGTWVHYSGSGPYKNTDHYSSVAGSTASFGFTGTKISYVFPTFSNRGQAKVTIDGTEVATISLNSSSLLWQQMWDSATLSNASHMVTVTVLNGVVDLDAFVVNRSGTALTNTPVPTNTPTPSLTPTPADVTPPTNPSSVTETHGIEDDKWQNSIDAPIFTWPAGSDIGTGVSHYLVYFGTDLNATPDTAQVSGYAPGPRTAGTYYLRMITVDIAGNQSAAQTRFIFRYDNIPPSNPTEAKEVNGAKDGTWQKDIATPNFSLPSPGSDANSGIGSYKVYFGSDSVGTPSKIESFPYSSGPNTSGTYYLRVIAIDRAGNEAVDTASLFTFKFDNTPPIEPGTLTTASDPTKDSKPTFSWAVSTDEHSGMGGSAGYQVYWGETPTCGPVISQDNDTTSFTPLNAIPGGTPYYICVRALDDLRNEGGWVGPSSFTYTP
jgi:hypothetical protein